MCVLLLNKLAAKLLCSKLFSDLVVCMQVQHIPLFDPHPTCGVGQRKTTTHRKDDTPVSTLHKMDQTYLGDLTWT